MQEYRIWECLVCGWVYDESKGAPEDGIPPGTRWEDIPKDWQCPECGVGKDDFEMIEVRRIAAETDEGSASPAAEEPATEEQAVPSPIAASLAVDHARAPVVIVGTGLAGYHLAREFRKLDQQTPLIMISADDGAHYSKPQLSTAFHKQRSPEQLVGNSAREMAESLGAQILTFTQVTAIDSATNTLTLQTGTREQRLPYGKLVLALGSDPIEVPVAGAAQGCAFSINDLQDFQRFYTALPGARSVLVIGGGLIGCEYANDLIQSGFEVHVVEPQAQVLGNLVPEAAGRLVEKSLADAGVQFHLGTTVELLDYADGGIHASLADGRELQVDRVISAIGVRPRIALASRNGIHTARGIVTDRYLATSAESIYALGDCAEVDGHNLCYVAPLLAGARALAQTLAGSPTPVRYGNMPVSIKTTLCPVTTSPPPRDAEGEWQYERNDTQGVAARFIDRNGRLLGFSLAGDASKQAAALSEQTVPVMEN
ncbi:FAD-dependent oxidoreductase [Microbulbifer sp. YPW1]|uniref:FAD-dependent oxidoreductase n=1 Tax=Microbulbifer sp. YPW1 TaxID=2745199 RepID=UPI00159A61B4|nr:FAD-dependent oxidoreductase [Microbulbifer sp. YPW1]QKX18540.1 FAD-dependent oxidoreductase [Microbulbifer sp. YPW1]